MRLSGGHTQAVMAQVREIPPERFAVKVRNTLVGLLFIGGAVGGAVKLGWGWYVVLPVAVFGGYFISQDLTKKGLNLIVAAVKDLFSTVKPS